MNNPRLFLWVALALILFVNVETWMHDYASAPAPMQSATIAPNSTGDLDSAVPQSQASPTASAAKNPASTAAAPASTVSPAAAEADTNALAGTVTVTTDVLGISISLRGGELDRADVLQYPKVKNQPGIPVRLFRREGNNSLYVMQTGLAASAATQAAPTHQALFTSTADTYSLGAADELRVPLSWTSDDGVKVTKTFIFHKGSYRIDLDYAVTNGGANVWSAAPYAQILHSMPPVERSYMHPETYAFDGPSLWDGHKYRKLKITSQDDANFAQDIKSGWIAAQQHHFVSAIIPSPDDTVHYALKVRGNEYLATALGAAQTVAPGATATIHQVLYVGPALQAQLNAISPELDRVANYEPLTFIARPLFWLLTHMHKLVGNWGVAIILTTLLLKLLFYPLSEASGKSQARMRTLGPRIKALQEQYKDDREKLGRAMMDFYKREKINPAAGCLPILIQLPVFLAFYWVLRESVEIRQAPFVGWIQDLSAQDPFYVLPIIMAAAMFVQTKLAPKPPDEMQAKLMTIVPLVMSVTFAFFPAGLVLYWVTNTLLGILQTWNINRRTEAAYGKR